MKYLMSLFITTMSLCVEEMSINDIEQLKNAILQSNLKQFTVSWHKPNLEAPISSIEVNYLYKLATDVHTNRWEEIKIKSRNKIWHALQICVVPFVLGRCIIDVQRIIQADEPLDYAVDIFVDAGLTLASIYNLWRLSIAGRVSKKRDDAHEIMKLLNTLR
jgi:hypothetical protein